MPLKFFTLILLFVLIAVFTAMVLNWSWTVDVILGTMIAALVFYSVLKAAFKNEVNDAEE